jgi:membrane protein required for colicin V production
MNYIDYIILALIILGFFLGYKDGLIRKLIGLAGLILGIFISYKYNSFLGKVISPIFENEQYLAEIIAAFIIFFSIIVVASILKRIVHPHDKVNNFINQSLGGIIGTVQIYFFISLLLLLLNVFNYPDKETKQDSLLYNYTYNFVPQSFRLLLGGDFKTKNLIRDFVESKDDTLSTGNN